MDGDRGHPAREPATRREILRVDAARSERPPARVPQRHGPGRSEAERQHLTECVLLQNRVVHSRPRVQPHPLEFHTCHDLLVLLGGGVAEAGGEGEDRDWRERGDSGKQKNPRRGGSAHHTLMEWW